jgi:hypothetical protein
LMAISAGGRASWQFPPLWQFQLVVERDGNFRRDGNLSWWQSVMAISASCRERWQFPP